MSAPTAALAPVVLIATPCGLGPTAMVSTTLPSGLITDTVPAPLLAT